MTSSIFSYKGVQHLFQLISYSFQLTLRHVMDSAKQATKSGNLNELSMVLLNNILSLPLGIILVLGFNEVDYLLET
jgi:GDP-mannose transporter